MKRVRLTRRQVLTGAALAAAAGAADGVGRGLSALASVTVGPHGAQTGGDALVVLFLRGGADGLSLIAPHGEEAYYRFRPTLALARPKDRAADAKARVLDLDGFFGLNPALAPLLPLYREGLFAPVHAVGSGDQTHSHFEAMATMERGLAQETGAASGWLARHLATTAMGSESPLRAVALTDTMPDSLRGATNATSLLSLTDFRLVAPEAKAGNGMHGPREEAVTQTLRDLYSAEAGAVGDRAAMRSAGRETLAALDAVKALDPARYRPAPGVVYPAAEIGTGLRQAACLIKGDVGLEVACLDMYGWDTHFGQGRDAGLLPSLLGDLGRALAAFAADLGPRMAHVTTLVMTEFGRRVEENYSLGTDHGHGSCLFALGGGVAGGRVYGEWPGLTDRQLDGPGDLKVTTDYRDVLAEALSRRVRNPHIEAVFPQFTPRFRNLFRDI